jgi:hypothetical protein
VNPAFHVVSAVLQDVSSFCAGVESLQSFLPVQMWDHNSDGPSEERKIHQLHWLVPCLFSSLHTCKTNRSRGGEYCMQVMAVGIRGIQNAYEILARKSQVNRSV